MKRKYILLYVLVLCTVLVNAQEERKNSFGINLGIGKLDKQDLIFSPFIVSDWSTLNALLEYGHSGRSDHEVSLRFGQYSAYTGEAFSYYSRGVEYEKYPHSFTNLELNYSLSKKMFYGSHWTVSAGGRIRNRFQISNFEFGHAGQFSYHLSSGLDAILKAGYRSGVNKIEAGFALPLFSFLARSPFSGQDDLYLERIMVHGDLKIFAEHLKTLSLQSWKKSQMADIKLDYTRMINEKWEIGLSYLFSMNLHSDPLKYASIENVIYLGTTLKF